MSNRDSSTTIKWPFSPTSQDDSSLNLLPSSPRAPRRNPYNNTTTVIPAPLTMQQLYNETTKAMQPSITQWLTHATWQPPTPTTINPSHLPTTKLWCKQQPQKHIQPPLDKLLDNEHWGNVPTTNPMYFQVISKNVNSLSTADHNLQWWGAVHTMIEMDAHVLCIQEPNLHWTDGLCQPIYRLFQRHLCMPKSPPLIALTLVKVLINLVAHSLWPWVAIQHESSLLVPIPLASIPPLSTLLGHNSLTMFGCQVLDGTADLQNLDVSHHTKLLLQHQKAWPQSHLPHFHNLTFDNMIEGFWKWLECTSTSLSGWHLGIYKSLAKDANHTQCKQCWSLQPQPTGTQQKSPNSMAKKFLNLFITCYIWWYNTATRTTTGVLSGTSLSKKKLAYPELQSWGPCTLLRLITICYWSGLGPNDLLNEPRITNNSPLTKVEVVADAARYGMQESCSLRLHHNSANHCSTLNRPSWVCSMQ